MIDGINKIIIVGNVGSQPEHDCILPSREPFVRVRIATHDVQFDKQTNEKHIKVEWHNVIFWGNLANSVSRSLRKGYKVYIEGRICSNENKISHTRNNLYIEAKYYQIICKNPKNQEFNNASAQLKHDLIAEEISY